jgi:two-component system response regulator MtrA
MTFKILVVEDEVPMSEMLCQHLEAAGYEAYPIYDGEKAFEAFKEFAPDLVLLDWNLPGKTGDIVCKEIREVSGVPIILLTAKVDDENEEIGLKAGADDYVKKPYPIKLLITRIEVALGRPQRPITSTMIQLGPLEINVPGHEVKKHGERVALTPLEFELLLTLAEKPKEVFTREILLEKVWKYPYTADTRLVNVHVQRLRSKIEDDPDNPKIVVTERGVGYKAGQF